MFIQSKFTKIFQSTDLTRTKYDELVNFALYVRELKNKVSNYVAENILSFLDMNKFQFITDMRQQFPNCISSSFDKQIFLQVLTCYQNKFDAIQRKLSFTSITFKGFEYYKRKTKEHNKGDFKKVSLKKEQTPLSICLTYLARYGNENILDYIQKQLQSCDDKKKEFYENILRCCEKFGFNRILGLALAKRKRIIEEYSKKPIEFKSLTFGGRSRKKKIIDYNKKFGSKINSFISLSGFGRKSLDIPVKFNKDWHGKMTEYEKKTNDYEYLVSFDEKHKQVKVYLCKDGERYLPDVTESSEVVGIDVNIKHNLFCLSDGTTYDYDRKLVNDYCKLVTYLDSVKEKEGKDYKPGKRYQFKIDKLREKIRKSEQQLISDICKDLQAKGITHVVMENLDGGFGKSYVKDKTNEDINFNRIVNFLRISSLKDEFEHIARNYGIGFSTVQSYYTSKMCPVCGCIEDENRPTQEDFCCIECGHSENADFNAAINIRNRVVEAVLREHLLKQSDNGTYKPKNLKKEKVKEVLLSCRTNLQKGRESNFS